MKNSKIILLCTAVIFLLFIAACASQGSANLPVASSTGEPTAAATAITDECAGVPTPSQDIDAVIREKLQDNHSIDRVYSANHTRDEWNATLDRMIGYGANINETEKQQIIDYLVCFHP